MDSCPDRQLVVKCCYIQRTKKITFQSARNCTYNLLRSKVDICFSLSRSPYTIYWRDDDGETINICSDENLAEAIKFFKTGDENISSAASILSGRSFGSQRKIVMHVEVVLEYEGNLSDTSSLASFDDFRSRNESQQSLSAIPIQQYDLEEDAVTVSSRDLGSRSSPQNGVHDPFDSKSSYTDDFNPPIPPYARNPQLPEGSGSSERFTLSGDSLYSNAAERYPADPSRIMDRLSLDNSSMSDSSSIVGYDLARNSRGQHWLQAQTLGAIESQIGPAVPSETDSESLYYMDDNAFGDLALERNGRGSYYYAYTGSSQSHGDGPEQPYDDTGTSESGAYPPVLHQRPSSMQLDWLASQRNHTYPPAPISIPSVNRHSDALPIRTSYDLSIDQAVHSHETYPSEPPEGILTNCSCCGTVLNAIRYICSTCGPKEPLASKGKTRINGSNHLSANEDAQGSHSSSPTMVGSSDSLPQIRTPPSFPSLPSFPSIFNLRNRLASAAPEPQSPVNAGYELCLGCIQTVGIEHAINASSGFDGPRCTPGVMSTTLQNTQWALHRRKAPPKKGQLRHAYREKIWGQRGWEDVVQEESSVSKCSTCSVITHTQRYKCLTCENFGVCRGCYSQIHNLHPLHCFVLVPDEPKEVSTYDTGDEQSLKHPHVRCFHCMMDILGARFHCAICPNVDICSKCEFAGLPGDLHSSEGGHDSSHILIKIPFPLGATQVQNASRRAILLWKGGDAASVGYPASPQGTPEMDSYARTVVGVGSSRDSMIESPENHQISCDNCRRPIIGVRFQCAHCPSLPHSYNLCANCETRGHIIHDPMHIFFKLPRRVQTPIQSQYALVPSLYKLPAGPQPHSPHSDDPQAYLQSLRHDTVACDCCMEKIHGPWLHCANCSKDLCEDCETLATHPDYHVFLIFKSNIEMSVFKTFSKVDANGARQVQVLNYLVYSPS